MDKFRHISGIPQSLFRAILARISRPNKLPLERFANRAVLCKYRVHADLLEGPKDKGRGRCR